MNADRPKPFEVPPEAVRPVAGAEPVPPAPAEVIAAETRPVPAPPPALVVPVAPPRRVLPRAFGWSLGLFAAGAIAFQLWEFVTGVLSRNDLVGTALASALIVAVATGGAILLREITSFGREMRKLREVEALYAEATELLAGEGHGRALALAGRVLMPLEDRAELREAIEYFRGAATTAHSDRQVLDLLAETVVRPLDRRAYQAVSRASRDAGLGVTMSPFGLLDAGIVLWRGLRMVREVAAVYGFRPGFFARGALIRRVFYTAATQGAADFVADAMLSHVGARLAGILSARVGEGVLTGMRTARLGIITMAACRPLPFLEQDKASIARLGSEVVASLGGPEERR